MSYEEKRTWAYLVTSLGAYVVYLVIIWQRVLHTPVSEIHYVAVLLWTALASMIASMLLGTMIETARPSESRRADVRDRDIARFGEHVSRWCVVAGAGTAMFMAMARLDYFWIANTIYLGFVLWAVVGSVLRLVAYRRGLTAHA
ncbi:MAG TPA: hypothetical protein VKB69_16420 [Micromonosporaceae bacterium]|nr:hypothetical protein [Micromonosporaceae bacterium]